MPSTSGAEPLSVVDPTIDELLRPRALEAWLDEHAPQVGDGPLDAVMLQGGVSNAVYRITRGADAVVLRRPPSVPRPDGFKIIGREARVLAALHATPVPAPAFIAATADDSIIGAPFYLMELIDGFLVVSQDRPAPYDDPTSEQYPALAHALIGGLAELALVDHRAVGLEDFGRADGFLARQVERWLGQLASYAAVDGYAGREIPGLDYVTGWLRANTAETRYVGVIHCDYSFANSMYRPTIPPTLAAVIDWEMATIGDTMLDLGAVLYGFRSDRDETPPVGFFGPEHFPTREELAESYADRTHHSIDDLDFYIVLAIFKLASIMEGHLARAMAGKGETSRVGFYGDFVLRIVAKAAEIARRAG
jgi:aminoglycoside phosphotransferase (APT) family kinase protein